MINLITELIGSDKQFRIQMHVFVFFENLVADLISILPISTIWQNNRQFLISA